MLDFSENVEEQKKYVTSYRVDGKDIVINYAIGDKKRIPYTEAEEKSVLETMENQASSIYVKSPNKNEKILSVVQPALFLPVAISNVVNNPGNTFYVIIAVCVGFGAIYFPAKVISYKIKCKEAKKINYFLKHKEELNGCLVNRKFKKYGLTEGLSRKAKKGIEEEIGKRYNPDSTRHEQMPVNINNIECYSLKDLVQLRANIEEIKARHPELSDDAMTLTMKPKKNKAVAVNIFADLD